MLASPKIKRISVIRTKIPMITSNHPGTWYESPKSATHDLIPSHMLTNTSFAGGQRFPRTVSTIPPSTVPSTTFRTLFGSDFDISGEA